VLWLYSGDSLICLLAAVVVVVDGEVQCHIVKWGLKACRGMGW